MRAELRLPAGWLNGDGLEQVLTSLSPHDCGSSEVHFRVPAGSQVMVDAAVRLLSLLNQLDLATKRVIFEFEDGDSPVQGYLNRIGFFDRLAVGVEVRPQRPTTSAAQRFRGRNAGVVEIERIDRAARDSQVLRRLSHAVRQACGRRADIEELDGATWTIFAELIDNVFAHSETPLDGFAALQVYERGNCLKVVVSDSGLGIMRTLRPVLAIEHPKLAALSDDSLLVEVFRQGLSRHGADRGCGLKGCASKAIKFKADLDVRLPQARVLLVPGLAGYRANTAHCSDNLALLWGTHVCFTLRLD